MAELSKLREVWILRPKSDTYHICGKPFNIIILYHGPTVIMLFMLKKKELSSTSTSTSIFKYVGKVVRHHTK